MAEPTRSKVWLHFSKDNDSSATCTKCQTLVKVKQGSTTNLHKHLKRHHAIELDTSIKIKKPNATTSSSTTTAAADDDESNNSSHGTTTTLTSLWTKFPTTSVRHRNISRAVANYIIKDMRPLDSVNDLGFRQLIATLEPRFNLNSRTYITETLLPQIYNEERSKLQESIRKATFVSLTTDSWTSRSSKSFTTVTAQYLTDDWELESKVLVTREVIESHTAENIACDFEEILAEWQLAKHGVSVTTDNASNITSAMNKCSVTNIRCMAHTLNLACQKALGVPAISRLCGKIRRIVTHFRRSTTAANVLRKATSQLDLPNLSPIIDVATRWNSTLDMVERYIVLRPAFCVALANPAIRSQLSSLTDREVNMAEPLIKVSF